MALLKEIAEMGADVTLTGFDPVNFDQVLIWPEEQDARRRKAPYLSQLRASIRGVGVSFLRIETIPISKIKRAKYNPRRT